MAKIVIIINRKQHTILSTIPNKSVNKNIIIKELHRKSAMNLNLLKNKNFPWGENGHKRPIQSPLNDDQITKKG